MYTRQGTVRLVSRAHSIRSLLLTLLLFVPPVAGAAEYWSVGTYRVEANALQYRDHIESATGHAAVVARFDDLYRVLVQKDVNPAAQRSSLESLGISPWTLSAARLDLVDAAAAPSANVVADQYLVISSFTDLRFAEGLMFRLERDGVSELEIVPARVDGVTYHRLVQGPFDSRMGVDEDYSRYGIEETWWLRMGSESGAVVAAAEAPRVAPVARSRPVRQTAPMSQRVEEMVATVREGRGEPAAAPSMETPVMVQPRARVAPEQVGKISPPKPGESYVDYCVGRANAAERAIYCRNETFVRLSTVGDAKERDLIYCALYATREEREARCRD